MTIIENDGEKQTTAVTRRSFVAGMVIVLAAPAAIIGARGDVAPHERNSAPTRDVALLHREFATTTETALGTVVAGGFRNAALSSVQIFDGHSWRIAPPMLSPRYRHAAVAFGGGVLVIGGLSATGNPLSHAEYFNGHSWVAIPPLRVPRYQHAAVLYNGLPFVIGGIFHAPLSSVEIYDGTVWRDGPSLSIPRFGHGAVTVNGHPTVNGGAHHGQVSVSESFDGVAWRRGPSSS